MNQIKVSLICTVKNEESSIKKFLDSLLSQSRLPDEIIITDGGSTDNTVGIINSFKSSGAPIKLFVVPDANRSIGRNTAVRNAKYEIITATDAGCVLDKNWLRNLVKPFDEYPDVDVVAGFYEPVAKSLFEECSGSLFMAGLDDIGEEKFLPSTRSIGFKKGAWKKVGGFPEQFSRNEDTPFDINLKKAGCRFKFVRDALVYWRPRSNLEEVYKQMYSYARGDGQAGLFLWNYFRTYVLYLMGLLMIIGGFAFYPQLVILAVILALGYLLRFSLSVYRKTKSLVVFLLMPSIKLVTDIGHMYGYLIGTVERFFVGEADFHEDMHNTWD